MSRKRLIYLLSLILIISVFALLCGCSMKLSVDDDENESAVTEITESGNNSKSARNPHAYIFQYMDCDELNTCCSSIKSILENENVNVSVTVGRGVDGVSTLTDTAGDLAINGGADIVITIGSPCAEAVCPLFTTSGRTPVVFCAVTDPVGLGIVDNMKSPTGNCTGTAAAFSVKERFAMICASQPGLTKLGVICSASEQNCESQLDILRKECERKNIELVEMTTDIPSEIAAMAKDLMDNSNAVLILQDNMMLKNSWPVISQSIGSIVPVYGVTTSQIKDGCAAGYCYDFSAMGKTAGEQALKLLHGETVQNVPIVEYKDCTLYYNEKRMTDLYLAFAPDYQKIAKPLTQ